MILDQGKLTPALTRQEATALFLALPGLHLVRRVSVAPAGESDDGEGLFVWTAEVMFDDNRWHDAAFDDHYPEGISVDWGS
jgi:hypothetical protein